jgi:hypothetical protein
MPTGEDVRVRGQKRRMREEMTANPHPNALTLTLTLTPTLTMRIRMFTEVALAIDERTADRMLQTTTTNPTRGDSQNPTAPAAAARWGVATAAAATTAAPFR